MACGERICHQVGHVRQCAMWKDVLICQKFYTRGCKSPDSAETVWMDKVGMPVVVQRHGKSVEIPRVQFLDKVGCPS